MDAAAPEDRGATDWFEPLYAAAASGDAVVPWDRPTPSALVEEWAHDAKLSGEGRRAVVVGCGLGRDAEFVAGLGYGTVGFDISPTAIETAKLRHPDSSVEYVTADLFDLPTEWIGGFDLVVESMTVQALPDPPRHEAIVNVGRLVAPGGTLVVVAIARADDEPLWDGPPWQLRRAEIDAFATAGLETVRVEDLPDEADPTLHRWRAEFRAPATPTS